MGGYKEYNHGKKVKGKHGQYLYSSEFCSIGGSGGYIYKNSVAFHEPWRYKNRDEIVYIPEYGFPDGKWERVAEDDLESKYTRQSDGIDRTGQAPVCYQEFSDVEWQDAEYRKYCLNRLVELGVTTKENVSKIMEAEME